jgi:hypothetical protein
MLFHDYRSLLSLINKQNTTLNYDPQVQQVSPPILEDKAIEMNFRMIVPTQQPMRVDLPWLETFKLAYLQYVSFLILCYAIIYKGMLGCAFESQLMGT